MWLYWVCKTVWLKRNDLWLQSDQYDNIWRGPIRLQHKDSRAKTDGSALGQLKTTKIKVVRRRNQATKKAVSQLVAHIMSARPAGKVSKMELKSPLPVRLMLGSGNKRLIQASQWGLVTPLYLLATSQQSNGLRTTPMKTYIETTVGYGAIKCQIKFLKKKCRLEIL